MTRPLRALFGIVVLAAMGSGCGPESPPETKPKPGQAAVAGPNARLRFSDQAKNAIKNGRLTVDPKSYKPGSPPRGQ